MDCDQHSCCVFVSRWWGWYVYSFYCSKCMIILGRTWDKNFIEVAGSGTMRFTEREK